MVPVESSCRTVEPTVAVLSYTYVYCRILSYTVELSYCRYCRTVAILSTTVEHYCRTVEPGLWLRSHATIDLPLRPALTARVECRRGRWLRRHMAGARLATLHCGTAHSCSHKNTYFHTFYLRGLHCHIIYYFPPHDARLI